MAIKDFIQSLKKKKEELDTNVSNTFRDLKWQAGVNQNEYNDKSVGFKVPEPFAKAQTWLQSPDTRVKLGNDQQYNQGDSWATTAGKTAFNFAKGATEGVLTEPIKVISDVVLGIGSLVTQNPNYRQASFSGRLGQDLASYPMAKINPFQNIGKPVAGKWNVFGRNVPDFGVSESPIANTAGLVVGATEPIYTALGAKNPKAILSYLGASGLIGGGANTVTGGDFGEGAKRTMVDMAPKVPAMAGFAGATNKLTTFGKLPIRTGANILQGIGIDRAMGAETTPTSIAIDAVFPGASDAIGKVTGKAFKSAGEALKSVQAEFLTSFGKKLRNNKGLFTTQDKFIKGTRAYIRSDKAKMASAGFMAGVEPYQDTQGNWKVRFNTDKALTGAGVAFGGLREIRNGDLDSTLKSLNRNATFKAYGENAKDMIAQEAKRLADSIGGVQIIQNGMDGRGIRVSMNPSWYRSFYSKYGRPPTNDELFKLAEGNLRNGKLSDEMTDAGELKAVNEFLDAEIKGGAKTVGLSKPQPTQLDPLLQEARKYGSAEEFVKAQGTPVYHGTMSKFDNFDVSKKVPKTTGDNTDILHSFTDNPSYANLYGNRTVEAVVDVKKPLELSASLRKEELVKKLGKEVESIIPESEFNTETYWAFKKSGTGFQNTYGDKLIELAKKKGYDGIKFPEYSISLKKYQNVVQPFSDAQIKTKSQLTDIYNQAKGVEQPQVLRQEPKIDQENLAVAKEQNPNVGSLDGKAEFNADQYIREQAAKQNITPDNVSFKTKADNTLQSIKTKFEDFTTPIETALNRAEKAGKFKILPQQDIRYQIDKVLRADSLGTQFIKDNGLADVIKNTDNLDELNQYLIAKQATDVSTKGIKTGRDLTSDKQLIESLGGKYEPVAQQIYAYNAKLRNYLVESGLISQDLSNALAKEYPNYVPLKRIFTEVEQSALKSPSGRGGPASIGSQNVVKRLKGSEREIVNPLESLLESTGVAFREGERNRGARMLGGYIKNGIIPGKEVTGTIGAKHTVSFLDNGVKRTYEVSPDIAAAAKDLNADQLSKALQIISIPTRILQLGATGVNVPFIVGNLIKDQLTALVISKKPLSTSIINPINFVKALFSSVKHDNLYADWVRSGSSFTSFDIARGSAPSTIASIRSNRNAVSKVKYLATNPGQLFRALEDIVGTTENLTRIQQYAGTKNALLKEGRILADADLIAGAASRTNTANFARKGEYGKVLNSVIPFFNAGIQGARSLRQSFISDPKGTSLRFTAFVGIPIATATLWNVSNYERKAAYEDIPDYEKEGNIIIMPEKPVKDENGNYDAIKIPITPGLANLGSIIRRQIEGAGANPQEAMRVLSDLSAAGTSFELPLDGDSARKLANQFTPQGLKLGLEPILNKNFYTGEDIVPSYMTKLPASEQVRDKTSGTARIIGGVLNTSPLKVENFVSSSGAGTGRQLLNLSDRVLANQGVIPQEQVGGRSVTSDIQSRFVKVRGGKKLNDLYEAGLTTKQIDKLLAQEEATAPRFSNSMEQSPEAPKTIMDKISLAAKGITVDPQNTIKAIFTEEVMRKITNDALIFERKTNINPGDNGLEYDHIIPLSLGGDNSPENLLGTDPKIKAVKDKLEKQLWRQLDSGEINKEEAQRQIRQFIADNGVGEPISAKTKDYVASLDSKKTDVKNGFTYVDDNGKEQTIDLDFQPVAPKLTGNAELDKKLKSKYTSEVTKKKNDIVKLYEKGQLTAEEAEKQLLALKKQQSKATGGAKKVTINFKAPTMDAGIKTAKYTPLKIKASQKLSLAPKTALSGGKLKIKAKPNIKVLKNRLKVGV